MPVYSFECRDCHKKFEVVQTLSEHDTEKVKCPACESTHIDRVWSEVFVETSRKS